MVLRGFAVVVLAVVCSRGIAQKSLVAPAWADQQTKKDEPEKVMTPEQAKELFASVDEIMAFAAKDTGLPAVPHVKRKLLTRAEVI